MQGKGALIVSYTLPDVDPAEHMVDLFACETAAVRPKP